MSAASAGNDGGIAHAAYTAGGELRQVSVDANPFGGGTYAYDGAGAIEQGGPGGLATDAYHYVEGSADGTTVAAPANWLPNELISAKFANAGPLIYETAGEVGYGWDNSLEPGVDAGWNNGGALSWYWLQARPYDPRLRRFLQRDPAKVGGLPDYVYANDDPLDVSDPSRLDGTPAQSSCTQQGYTNDPVQHVLATSCTMSPWRDLGGEVRGGVLLMR